jgi:hypothetical protein
LLPYIDFALARMSRSLAVFAILAFIPAIGWAQRTVITKGPNGGKIELYYNADGKVVEQHTVGPDGKLQEKAVYEYLPGYIGAQETSTSYWPNGTISEVARETYDENSNFTGEFIETFDKTGKQIGGHRLTHDPWTNVYACAGWNTEAKSYVSVTCPSGEESPGADEKVKKFSYEEVAHALAAARKAVQPNEMRKRMLPVPPVQPPITIVNREIGIVLPAQVHAGEQISGILTEDPQKYDGLPEVRVTRIEVPFESAGEASQLGGWRFETSGEQPQSADGPITFSVPRGHSGLKVTLRQAGNPDHAISKILNFPHMSGQTKPSRSFESAALCLKGQLCMVRGRFSGDSRDTFAAIRESPATIVAETPEAVFISIPDLTLPGSQPLFISEGKKVIAFPLAVGEFFVKNNGRELQQGQTLIVFPTLDGPSDIPDELWRTGNFPASNLQLARELIPGFRLAKVDRDARENKLKSANGEAKEARDTKGRRESEENEGGVILLVVENGTPEQMSMRGSKNHPIVFHLRHDSFSRGEFRYDMVVEALKPGTVDLKEYVIPFLAPIKGQVFTVENSSAVN